MKIDITGRHIEVTPALREFAEERLRKLEKLLIGPLEAHVVLGISKHRHTAEVQVKSKTVTLAGAEETDDLYASIREVADKLERQALRHKQKVREHKQKHGPRDPEVAAQIGAQASAAEGEPIAEELEAPRILNSQRYRLKPMSAEDAILELEATAEDLLMFRESTTDRINVVYRQKDGNFVLIDPEF